MLSSLPILPSLESRLKVFRPVFAHPSAYDNFRAILIGTLLSVNCSTIAGAVRAAGLTQHKHFSAFYRLFGRARWKPEDLGWTLWAVVLARLLDGIEEVVLVIDDTLHNRVGRKVYGAGFQHDPLLPIVNKRRLNWGNCWVTLAVVITVRRARWPVAFPLFSRLYLPRKVADKLGKTFQTKPQLAREMLDALVERCPGLRFCVLVDKGYSNKTMLRGLSEQVTLLGRLPLNAKLSSPPVVPPEGKRGRKRKWGERQRGCVERAEQDAWQEVVFEAGHVEHRHRVQSWTAQWRGRPDGNALRVVLIERDNRRKTRVPYFSTDPHRRPEEILGLLRLRWTIEVMFHEVKEELGCDGAQSWCEASVERVWPARMLLYSLLWWEAAEEDVDADDIPDAQRPWYRHKQGISFSDLLRRARLASLLGPDLPFSEDSDDDKLDRKSWRRIRAWIMAVL